MTEIDRSDNNQFNFTAFRINLNLLDGEFNSLIDVVPSEHLTEGTLSQQSTLHPSTGAKTSCNPTHMLHTISHKIQAQGRTRTLKFDRMASISTEIVNDKMPVKSLKKMKKGKM